MSTQMSSPEQDVPAPTLVHGVAGNACAMCGTAMATDQRYCISCGARRGRPRFNADALAATEVVATASHPGGPPPASGRSTTATALIAGVGTLLLAMGVGVLIGHSGQSSAPSKASAPQVITVGGAVSADAKPASSGKTKDAKGSKADSKKAKVKTVTITPEAEKAAASAAAKTLGGAAPKDPTVGVGEECTPDTDGCDSTGHFDGSFFGP